MRVELRRVDWAFATPFRIAYQVRTHAETVVVELRDGPLTGRGEAVGVSYQTLAAREFPWARNRLGS
jgi:hypothetical protein